MATKTKENKKLSKSLVIVESPTKAKTIRKFLPSHFQVEASIGHVRDLPASAKEIPARYKKESWASLGINVENNFEPIYVIPPGKTKIIRHLSACLESAQELVLATDEDREGESISYHLMKVLKPKMPVKRMVFHEITKEAIEEALQNFRDVDMKLVQAQESRRILDRLVGYSLSPLIWKKIAYGLSAGRVQSVAVRLIVEREEERMRFKKGIYCGLLSHLHSPKGDCEAKCIRWNNSHGLRRIATGKDFDEHTGQIAEDKKKAVHLFLKDEAEKLLTQLKKTEWFVKEVEEKPFSRKPSPPFITSTLQQEGNRKLGLSSRETMRVAQGLYEKGFITYMRTDSVFLSEEALRGSRKQVKKLYGEEFLSPEPRQFSSQSKLAQEAHEAIRPAGPHCMPPQETGLQGHELSLYELIWKRTMATQMAESKHLSVSIIFEASQTEFQATGSRILFPGFLRAYVEGADDVEAALEEKEIILPELKVGEKVTLKKLQVTEHETKPPARYTEATLIQTLEKEGVGRPSTYASILSTVMDRGYVRRLGNALVPTLTAFAVHKLLKKHFPELVDLQFTASMEETLDEIAEGKKKHLEFLRHFYLDPKEGLKVQIEKQDKKIDPEEARGIVLEKFPKLDFRIGRFGPYFIKREKQEEIRVSLPDIPPADLEEEMIEQLLQQKKDGPPCLGQDPETKKSVYLMSGRYGVYVQLGENSENEDEKVKRAMIPKSIDVSQITLEQALGCLQLPRILGNDDKGRRVKAGLGRFGPYVMREVSGEKPEYRSLKKEDEVLTIDLERALQIFLEPRRFGRGRSAKKEALRLVGEHPLEKKPIEIYDGPYGLYCKCGKINASLPKDIKPSDLTLKQAIQLIDDRKTAQTAT